MRSFHLSAALLLVAASCTDAPVPTIPPPADEGPAMNTVSWVSVCCGGTFDVGDSETMNARAYDANGFEIPLASYTWSSSNSSVASVSVTGAGNAANISFNNPGSATITVSSGGRFDQATVQVLALPVVSSVTITPSPVELAPGATQQLTATAKDQYGQPITGGARTWSSANSSIASVSSSGVVTGHAAGSTTVQVTIDGVSKAVQVTVAPLKLTLSGTNYIAMDGTYTWSVGATGGTGSYSYSWSVEWPYSSNTVALGNGASQSLWVDSSSDTMLIMHVTVTSGSQTKSTSMTVCNMIVEMSC
jgi:hypothetical protein